MAVEKFESMRRLTGPRIGGWEDEEKEAVREAVGCGARFGAEVGQWCCSVLGICGKDGMTGRKLEEGCAWGGLIGGV
jgi:hypothetical protein